MRVVRDLFWAHCCLALLLISFPRGGPTLGTWLLSHGLDSGSPAYPGLSGAHSLDFSMLEVQINKQN
jgi:hypothetical protein